MNLEQKKEQKRQWYIKNKDEVKITQAKYRLENIEKIKEQKRKWYIENKDEAKISNAKYYLKNKDKVKVVKKEYYLKNKEHILANKKIWVLNNKDRIREYQLKRDYNLTLDQYNKMLSDQNGCCKICDTKMTKPHVDHCHTTGKVRALLCINCNSSLGQLKEDTKIMQKLIEYVKEHNE